MAESNNNIPELSPEQRRQHGPVIESSCRDAGLAPGEIVLLMLDEQVYQYQYEGASDQQTEGMSIPNCPTELCKSIRAQIDRICHDKAWPPDHPVLVVQPDGQVCYCYCC